MPPPPPILINTKKYLPWKKLIDGISGHAHNAVKLTKLKAIKLESQFQVIFNIKERLK